MTAPQTDCTAFPLFINTYATHLLAQALKLEHMNRINEAGWDELASSSGRVLERVAAEDWDVIRLGQGRPTP